MGKKKQTRAQYLERKRKHAEQENKLAQTKINHPEMMQRLEEKKIEDREEYERAVVEEQNRKRNAFLRTLTPEQREVWLKKDRERQMQLARTLGTMAGLGLLNDEYYK